MRRLLNRAHLGVAITGLFTVWVAMWSWSGLSDSNHFLGPVLGIGAAVIVAGALLRMMHSPRIITVLGQLLVAEVLVFHQVAATWWPSASGRESFNQALRTAGQAAGQYAPPVPDDLVEPMLVLAGVGCVIVVDLIAVTLRRVALAGLPLLAVVSIGTALLDTGLNVVHFVVVGFGFVLMLATARQADLSTWSGRDTVAEGVAASAAPGTVAVGVGSLALALLAAPLVPSAGITMFAGNGPGKNGGDKITLTNPIVDLQANLNRGEDQPLLQVRTLDPNPSYLRIALLTNLNSMTFTSGERRVPEDQQANGDIPLTPGLDPNLLSDPVRYNITALDSFESTWLPTYPEVRSIRAEGDWRYDTSTLDFTAVGDQSLAGTTYTLESSSVIRLYDELVTAQTTGPVDPSYLEVSDSIPGDIEQLTTAITADADSAFEKAVALQDWFRSGEFVYDTTVDLSGDDALMVFLTQPVASGGRTGFCQQFATAFALMARQLGIPSRVAVGFLGADRIDDGVYEFSSHDLHAWPELYFGRFGWIAFEPTPSVRAPSVPSYTRESTGPSNPGENEPTESNSPRPTESASPTERDQPNPAERDGDSTIASSASHESLIVALGVMVALALIGFVIGLPRLVRSRRRARRSMRDPEDVWAELRDTCRDLDIDWPTNRSPRDTAAVLVHKVRTPDQRQALLQITEAVERHRYAASAAEVDLEEALATVVAGLADVADRGGSWRVRWLPKSVLSGVRTAAPTSDRVNEDELVG